MKKYLLLTIKHGMHTHLFIIKNEHLGVRRKILSSDNMNTFINSQFYDTHGQLFSNKDKEYSITLDDRADAF